MNKDLSAYRKSYEKSELRKSNVPDNPMELFQKWFYEADNAPDQDEANTMTLSTIGLDGFPKGRVVLLKNTLMKDLFSTLIIIAKRVEL